MTEESTCVHIQVHQNMKEDYFYDQYPSIVKVDLPTDGKKNYGFVHFSSKQSAEDFIDLRPKLKIDGTEFDLKPELAKRNKGYSAEEAKNRFFHNRSPFRGGRYGRFQRSYNDRNYPRPSRDRPPVRRDDYSQSRNDYYNRDGGNNYIRDGRDDYGRPGYNRDRGYGFNGDRRNDRGFGGHGSGRGDRHQYRDERLPYNGDNKRYNSNRM